MKDKYTDKELCFILGEGLDCIGVYTSASMLLKYIKGHWGHGKDIKHHIYFSDINSGFRNRDVAWVKKEQEDGKVNFILTSSFKTALQNMGVHSMIKIHFESLSVDNNYIETDLQLYKRLLNPEW